MRKMNILLVDDDPALFDELRQGCKETFELKFCLDNVLFENTTILSEFQLIIINHDLEQNDGFSIYQQLHELYHGPIIFVSSKDDVDTRIKGLEMGADAFILLPCACREIELRINKILQHLNASASKFVGDYEIDTVLHKISYKGQELKLATMPYRLLSYMLNNPNVDISRDVLLNEVWGYDVEFGKRIIDTNINLLRQLTQDGNIKSVRGIGYRYSINE